MIVGLYLILPLLRLWVKKENKKQIKYFIILALLFTFLIPQIITIGTNYFTIFESINKLLEKINIKYVGGYTAYFILGWYLNNFDFKKKKTVYFLGIFSAIITILGTYILSASTGKAIQMYGWLTLNVFLQTFSVFVFVKDKFEKQNDKKNKMISLISKNSLGIYAIHMMIVTYSYMIIEKINFDIGIINILIVFGSSLLLSLIATMALHKIPVLKKVV